MDSRHDHRSLGAVVAGTARWASQHYRSRISHGFQKLPTYIYIHNGVVYAASVPLHRLGLYGLPAAVAAPNDGRCAVGQSREEKEGLARNVIASDDTRGTTEGLRAGSPPLRLRRQSRLTDDYILGLL